MKEKLNKWAEQFDSFSLRERGLIALTITGLSFIAWDSLVLNPQETKQIKALSEIRGLNQQMEELNSKVKSMTDKLNGGNAKQVETRLDELLALLKNLDRKQQDLAVQFIRPEQMANVLRDMLNNENKLTLIRLESLGASPLFPPKEATKDVAPANPAQPKQPSIYKHGMRVVFEGNYNSTLHYLQALETMPWRFYWDNVEYKVLDYPIARVVITVHTLSLNKAWIGV